VCRELFEVEFVEKVNKIKIEHIFITLHEIWFRLNIAIFLKYFKCNISVLYPKTFCFMVY